LTTYHPKFGELYSPKEVADLTGFTANQLRNWRQRQGETMPFGFIRQGGTSFYRKVVVDAWLEENDGGIAEYIMSDLDKKFPIERELATDREKVDTLKKLMGITTANAYLKWYQWYCDSSGLTFSEASNKVEQWQKELWALHTGLPLDQIGKFPTRKQRGEQPEHYWLGWTWSMRKAYADVYNLDVSNQEILDLPAGDVPPLKELS
jgi:transposase-like protein